MASGSVKKPTPTLYNRLYQAVSTNPTGDYVLGADYNSRMVVNVQTVNTTVMWCFGTSNPNTYKYIHFMNYDGTPLASTAVTFRVYWLDPSDFGAVEVTS